MATRNIILFELNEVPPEIIDYVCEKRQDSAFYRLIKQSGYYQTKTTDSGHLHPWSTWPTLHRGVNNEIHQIKDFGEDLTSVNKSYPPIWELLQQTGIKTGVFASLHTYPPSSNFTDYEFFIPDTFAAEPICHPQYVTPFQEFNLKMSRQSSRNVAPSLDKNTALQFMVKSKSVGIRNQTLALLARHVLQERINPWKATRRRSFQSLLAFDVFFKLLKKRKPQFTTFFSNHLAATMHRYWAATFPEQFPQEDLDERWIKTYQGEIDFALDILDIIFSDLSKFILKNPDYVLIISSSMGQKATSIQKLETELILKDQAVFMEFCGLEKSAYEVLPAMHPQYNFKVADQKIKTLEDALSKIRIGDKAINFRTKEKGFFSIDFGHVNFGNGKINFNGSEHAISELGLDNERVAESTAGTAYHIPEGILIIFDPVQLRREKSDQVIDTRAIAPSILNHYQVSVPGYMMDPALTFS